MIRCVMQDSAGHYHSGDEQLLKSWDGANDNRFWLDIEGGQSENIRAILESAGCNELSIKDCFRHRHPPKVEEFDNNTFVLFRGISGIDEALELIPQPVGLWIGENYLISVHSGKSTSIDHFWSLGQESILQLSPAELGLGILTYASGRYLEALLEFEERLSKLEDGLLSDQSEHDMKKLVSYRSNLRRLRRTLSYHNSLAHRILETGSSHLGTGDDPTTHIRRALCDRCERNYSLCNMFYELCGDLVEGHISLSSHNLNQTMKVLTIVSVLFVPLTFLAGIYGMNFEHIPELQYRYAYFILLGVMAVLAAAMLIVFRRIKWL